MRRIILAALSALVWLTLVPALSSEASAQNVVCPTAPAGSNNNQCASTAFVKNAVSGGGALSLPQNQIFIGNGLNAAAAVSLSGDCTLVSSGVITCSSSSGITGLTGDGTATGPGSVAFTLSTVNANVGTFGSATAVPQFVVNAKGLVTGVTAVTITPPFSAITGSLACGQTPALTGNVTTSAGTCATTIATGAVTNTMLAGSIDLTTKVTGVLPAANMAVATSAAFGTVKPDNSTITISGGVITAVGGGGGGSLTVGTTNISGGASNYVLYNNAGVLGNLPITGTGSVVLGTSPAIDSPTLSGTVAGANTIPLTILAQQGAATLTGNATASTANATAFTIQGLTDISSPSSTLDYIPIYDHVAGTIKRTTASELQTAVGGGVTSLGGLTGAVTCGSGVTCSGGSISVSGGGSTVTVGTTTVASGTDTYFLYNNAGTLGNKQPTGSGLVVLQTSPAITSPVFSGTVGGSGTIPNAVLVNSSTTIGGQATSLGGSTTNQGTGGKLQLATGTTTTSNLLAYNAAGDAIDSGILKTAVLTTSTSAGGDLTGTLGSATVAKINGVALGTTTANSANILIGSGTAWVSNAVTGDITITSAGVTAIGSNKVTLAKIATQAANTILGNGTAGSAVPTALAIPSCSTASSALTWTSSSGFGCNSISGAGTVTSVATGTGLTGGTITSTGTISLANIAANTLLANATAGTTTPTAISLPSCSTSTSALIYTTSSGFGCNTINPVITSTAGQIAAYNTTTQLVGQPHYIYANLVSGIDPSLATDSATGFNNLIGSSSCNGSAGCTIFVCGQYKINATININVAGVKIIGCGPPQTAEAAAGPAYFKYNGATTMFKVTGPLSGWEISNIVIDGQTVATNCFTNSSGNNGGMSHVSLVNCGVGLLSTTANGLIASSTYHNHYDSVGIALQDSTIGIKLSASGDAFTAANTTGNTFTNTKITVGASAQCVQLNVADTNMFYGTTCLIGSVSTSYGIVWQYDSGTILPASNAFYGVTVSNATTPVPSGHTQVTSNAGAGGANYHNWVDRPALLNADVWASIANISIVNQP